MCCGGVLDKRQIEFGYKKISGDEGGRGLVYLRAEGWCWGWNRGVVGL